MNAAYERARKERFSHSEIFSFDISAHRVGSRAHKRRVMRKARISYVLALVTLSVVVLGLIMQVVSLVEIYAAQANIRSLKSENVILSSRVENLANKYEFETQRETVSTRAGEMLGMVHPAAESVFALSIQGSDHSKILVSAK